MDDRKVYTLPNFLSEYGDAYLPLLETIIPRTTIEKARKMGIWYRFLGLRQFNIVVGSTLPPPDKAKIETIDSFQDAQVLEIKEK